jgi:hypothetical protein
VSYFVGERCRTATSEPKLPEHKASNPLAGTAY